MRVMAYTPCYPPDHAAYVHLIEDLATDITTAGHSVCIISTTSYGKPGAYGLRLWVRERRNGVDVVRINTFPAQKRGIVRKAIGFAYFTIVSFFLGLFLQRPDVIFAASTPPTMGLVGGLVARIRRVPFVYNVQDIFPDVAIKLGVLRSPLLIRCAYWIERVSYRLSSVVSVIAPEFQNVLEQKGVPAEKVAVIPNWIDTDAMAPPPKEENRFAREQGLQGRFILLYAGNFGLSQGLEALVDAAVLLRDLPDLLLLLIGDGERREALERYVAEKGLANVRMLPFQPQSRLHEVFGSADIGLVPLKRGLTSDSIPSKTWTMMAAGLPIIGMLDAESALGRFLVENGTGCMVEPESPVELARAVRAMHQSPTELAEMGARARRFTVEQIARSKMTNRYIELFTRLVVRRS